MCVQELDQRAYELVLRALNCQGKRGNSTTHTKEAMMNEQRSPLTLPTL